MLSCGGNAEEVFTLAGGKLGVKMKLLHKIKSFDGLLLEWVTEVLADLLEGVKVSSSSQEGCLLLLSSPEKRFLSLSVCLCDILVPSLIPRLSQLISS